MMRYLNLSILFVFALISTNACKVGDEDPAFSFRSRKARLVGEWLISSAVWEDSTQKQELTDGTIVTSTADTSLSNASEITVEFTNEGKYIWIESITIPANANLPEETQTKEIEGTWYFTGGNGTKNKSKLILQETKVTNSTSQPGSGITVISTTNPFAGTVFELIKLTKEELKLSYKTTVDRVSASDIFTANITLQPK